jgi:hypothetical protein
VHHLHGGETGIAFWRACPLASAAQGLANGAETGSGNARDSRHGDGARIAVAAAGFGFATQTEKATSSCGIAWAKVSVMPQA